MTDMDDLLIAIIVAGIGLSIAYLRAELILRQEFKAAEREKELALRELRITRPRREHTSMLGQPSTASWPIQINPFQVMRVWRVP
jgi:Arc/MetJ family transcription regulator